MHLISVKGFNYVSLNYMLTQFVPLIHCTREPVFAYFLSKLELIYSYIRDFLVHMWAREFYMQALRQINSPLSDSPFPLEKLSCSIASLSSIDNLMLF